MELNKNNHQHDSGNDSFNEYREQTFQGNCLEAEQSKAGLTEVEASDGMLFDALRTMLIMFLNYNNFFSVVLFYAFSISFLATGPRHVHTSSYFFCQTNNSRRKAQQQGPVGAGVAGLGGVGLDKHRTTNKQASTCD